MEPIIKTDGLVKEYRHVTALDDVSLTCPSGIIGLLGPNGAGKSTLIKILMGLVLPTSGQASIFGLDCRRNTKDLHKRIGILHEKPNFPSTFTANQFLQFVCELYEVTNSRERIHTVLDMVDLLVNRDEKIGNFSAGMVQRLGLAQSLIGTPDLVILDEPTANLDPLGRVKVLRQIRQLHEEFRTSFLISSHILHDIERVCDYIILIDLGTILLQEWLQKLISSSSSNTVKVQFRESGAFRQLPEPIQSVLIEQLDSRTALFFVEDMDVFEQRLFDWTVQNKIIIQQLLVESNLEQIYTTFFQERRTDKT
ncbi:MAG: ABC transporter ATP-binding protein [Promethearchaeota archaeon]